MSRSRPRSSTSSSEHAGPRAATSYLLISHDLGVVRYLADRIAVMYLGRIMEVGDSKSVFRGPNHPYTEALLSAVPSIDGEERMQYPSWRARCRVRPTRRQAASSTRAARGSSPGLCEVTVPPLPRGRARAHDGLPHPARGAAPAPAFVAMPRLFPPLSPVRRSVPTSSLEAFSSGRMSRAASRRISGHRRRTRQKAFGSRARSDRGVSITVRPTVRSPRVSTSTWIRRPADPRSDRRGRRCTGRRGPARFWAVFHRLQGVVGPDPVLDERAADASPAGAPSSRSRRQSSSETSA